MAGRVNRPVPASPWLARTVFVLGCLFAASVWLPRVEPRARAVATLAVVLVGLAVEQLLRRVRAERVAGSFVGLFVGAGAGAALLVLVPTAGPGRALGPFVVVVLAFLGAVAGGRAADALASPVRGGGGVSGPSTVIDTSGIVDGRIADVVDAGFLPGTLVVPQFVLGELQGLADSTDASVRERGQRGLAVLERLKSRHPDRLVFPALDSPEREIDERLVRAAERLAARLATTDSNLQRVAGLRGVDVVDVHALARALRPELRPGDRPVLRVVRAGREPGQGLAFLDDGAMVVIERAADRIGDHVRVEITGALDKPSGRIFFGRPDPDEPESPESGQNG